MSVINAAVKAILKSWFLSLGILKPATQSLNTPLHGFGAARLTFIQPRQA
jgi:hypothetical protein